MAADNFAVSPDEKYIAVTGCEKKKKQVFKNIIYVFEVKKMKKLSSTILKIQNSEGGTGGSPGTIKKMNLLYTRQGLPLLVAITDGTYSFYVYEIKDSELRFVCKKDQVHKSSPSSLRVRLRPRLQRRHLHHLLR